MELRGVADLMSCAAEWFSRAAAAAGSRPVYPFLLWNCLARAGGRPSAHHPRRPRAQQSDNLPSAASSSYLADTPAVSVNVNIIPKQKT